MSYIKVTLSIEAVPKQQSKGWLLTVSATDNTETGSTTLSDGNVFVMRSTKSVYGDREVFSHVASLWEMSNLPSNKVDVPPKSSGFYRSSIAKLEFNHINELNRAATLITDEVGRLITASETRDLVEATEVEIGTPPTE